MFQDHIDQLLEIFSDGICVTDARGTVLHVNTKHEELTGIPHKHMIGHNIGEFVGQSIFDIVLNPEVLRTGKVVTKVQTLADGHRLVLEGHPILGGDGTVAYCVTLLRDESRLSDLQSTIAFQKELLDVFSKLSNTASKEASGQLPEIVNSPVMEKLYRQVNVIAPTDAPVLILGETGVGKDVLARRIHISSDRAERPFIKVDCGSIASTLIETELFGYVGGTFSGASKNGKVGLIEAADKGTLFLDEIGELPIAMQTRLLRFLQDGEIMRVGATTPKHLDVRIIAATNRDLEKAIADGEFRSDLYYRLKIAVLTIPPLRERTDDILPMAHFFLDVYAHKYGHELDFAPEADKAMLRYQWPGNVRELRNMVQGLAVTSTDGLIRASQLPFSPAKTPEISAPAVMHGIDFEGKTYKDVMRCMEAEVLKAALARWGSMAVVAKELRIDRSTIFRKVKELQKRGVDLLL